MDERVPLVIVPFRSLLHMQHDEDRRRALRAVRELLLRAAASSSTSSRPSREDIEATNGRWLEREPEIFERADWDEEARTLTLSVRGGEPSRRCSSRG